VTRRDREQAALDHKDPEAFRTISEVADELDLPQHVLRFWETRFRDIRPMKRGGGRRYYRPDDIDLLRGVRHLLYGEGYTIRGVQRILAEQGVKFVQAVWQTGAPQPPHRAGAQDQDDETGDDAIDVAEEDDSEEEAPRRGLRDRLTSLIGRDLNETNEPLRRDPPMQSAPLPQIAPVDRFAPAVEPEEGEAPPAPSPRPAVAQPVVAAGLPREDLRKLQAALHELGECRKLLAGGGSR